jgi:hypothetical protein
MHRWKDGIVQLMSSWVFNQNDQEMGTSPWDASAIASNAAWDKSMELALLQVGHASATVTVTLLPFCVLVIWTCFPQRGDALPVFP